MTNKQKFKKGEFVYRENVLRGKFDRWMIFNFEKRSATGNNKHDSYELFDSISGKTIYEVEKHLYPASDKLDKMLLDIEIKELILQKAKEDFREEVKKC